MSGNPVLLTRRGAIKGLGTLLGGTLGAAQLGLLSRTVAAMTADEPPQFLNAEQFELLTAAVEAIIPRTDTPGATDAGVHRFIDLMLAEWASPERQARYVAGIAEIDRRARANGAAGFSASSAAAQADLLRALDRERFAEGAGEMFFAEFKNMVLFAYYSSEIGATVELRYQPIPGDYLPCIPVDGSRRAWFWNGYSYAL